ncbi:MAG: acyl-CoA dehydrogenase family protein [Candidatus Caldarchaeum sp.]|nr:acyl-CoA/acyl-ACP dehydrogenase [Candidatus Caldarchaeum sp.]MCX8201930.1 acyl-CoA/acyl-ACP dehydrogenase [Candidatus Caldarchaeum sp.]MDW8063212.1 acyl-CoA dehydrogenase family protein [Candidatus Caldarchaeum sp.]MDW8435282.1 acyl-CoA dehydrogenase family protein [Candidatus Caldarchaeum sp.]
MDFEESEEVSFIRKTVAEFMKRFPVEYWRKVDAERRFPEEYWKAAAEQGLLGINIPEKYGGLGMGLYEVSAAIIGVAASGGGLPAGDLLMRTMVFAGLPIEKFGSEEVKNAYLPKLVEGKLICSFAHTEPNAGVNTFDIQTYAQKEGDGYRINGQKIWITLAHMADIIVVVARTTPREKIRKKSEGLTLLLVDAKQNGVKTSKIYGMALRPLSSNLVYFEDVWVPESHVLGVVDRGWEALSALLNAERVCTASISIGCGEFLLEKAVDYASNRRVFGRPIGSNQAIQFPLAEVKAELETAKLMTQKAAWLFDKGKDCAFEANVAALTAARAAFKAADRAVQTFGGNGFAEDNDIERFFRDTRLFKTAPVPEEMVLNYIGTRILNMPRSF